MEENKGPIKLKLTTVILLFIILIIVMTGIFYYSSNPNNKTNHLADSEKESLLEKNEVITANTSNTNQSNNAISQAKELDINSNLVKKLYNYVLKYSDYEEKLVYQSLKVTNDTINNKLKLMTIFENLDESEADEIIKKNEYGIEVTHTLFNKETVEKKAKEIFGNFVGITHQECPIYFTKAIDYKNGVYDCYSYQGGGNTPWEKSISQIKNAEEKDDEIYLYDQYIHIYDDITETTSEEGIYTASDKKTKISNLINVSANSGLESEQYEKELFTRYEEKLGNKIQTFKHTFKKGSDGTYYWYSTEPIES